MPTSLRLNGDRNRAAQWWGEAKRVLFQLKSDLEPLGIPHGWRTRKCADGSIIRVGTIYGADIIEITSPFVGALVRRLIENLYIFLYSNTENKLFYFLKFPSIRKAPVPTPFLHTDYPPITFGAHAYAIGKTKRKSHLINLSAFYTDWNLVKDDDVFRFPIRIYWNVPATCIHSHIRGGSEAAKWGTCGYVDPGGVSDAILPPFSSMLWPYRSVCPFPYGGKKKTMNPTRSIWVPIPIEDKIVSTEIDQFSGIEHGISGVRNFKLNADEDEVESWLDTLQVSGVGNLSSSGYWTPTGDPAGGLLVCTFGWYAYPSPGWFFKPWYSWAHENPTFDFFGADEFFDASQKITTEWDLQPRSPYRFRRKYFDVGGLKNTNNIFVDTASYVYSPVTSTNYHNDWKDDRCPGALEGDAHSLDISMGEYGGNANGIFYFPMACLGDNKYLFIESSLTSEAGHSGWSEYGTKHEDNHPCDAYNCALIGNMTCYCREENAWQGPLVHRGDLTKKDWSGTWGFYNSSNSTSLNQVFKFSNIILETLSSSFLYGLAVNLYNGNYQWIFAHSTPVQVMGGWACPYDIDESGNVNLNTRQDAETWNRYLNFVEVLAYDNISTDIAIIIYKKVSIQHAADYDYSASGTDPLTEFYTSETDAFNWSAARQVSYWLWYKIGGTVNKIQLSPHLAGNASGSFSNYGGGAKVENQTANGQRIYGASCQVNKDYIVYSFLVEDFIAGNLGLYNYYSSAINWEDRDRLGKELNGAEAWKPNKMILGAIKIETLEHVTKEVTTDVYSARMVYTVGVHLAEDERIIE